MTAPRLAAEDKLASASATRPTVVIVDDARASRDLLAEMVESLGYRAVSTGNGLEGLRLIQQHRASLVLLDVVMPGLDGFKIAAAIKAQPRFVPVILLTALSDLQTKRRGQAAGADDFISKPVDRLELDVRIAAMMRIKALTDELDAANRRLSEIAHTDALTMIANRRSIEETLKVESVRATRYHRLLAVYLLDIDHFKRVNDTYGHASGDLVLKAVAQTLSRTLRQADRVGRWGGEEFCVIAPEVDRAGAQALGERLRRAVEMRIEPGVVAATMSVGGAFFSGEGECAPAALLERADAALYRAKANGRNRVEIDDAVNVP